MEERALIYDWNRAEPAFDWSRARVELNDETLRTSLAKAARARAKKFTWDRTAAGVAEVVRELLS